METNIKDLTTEGGSKYIFFPTTHERLHFKVQASKDVQIALTTGPQESDPIYEIFIGASNNTKSSIMKNQTKPEKVEVQTPEILSDSDYRGFWVNWTAGVIMVGKEGEVWPFMAWTDPKPFVVTYVGVASSGSTVGKWKIEDNINTSKVEYQFFEVLMNTSLCFEVRAPNDAQVALTNQSQESEHIYEVLIGIEENTKSAIRKNNCKPNLVEVYTPFILSDRELRGFWIRWDFGVISVGRKGQVGPFMAWTDPDPFSVCFYGFGTPKYITSIWTIKESVEINLPFPQPALPLHPSQPSTLISETVTGPIFPMTNTPISGEGYHPWGREWVDALNGEVPPKAVVGGHDSNGAEIYVIRALHENMTIPGKLLPSDGCAYIAWEDKVYPKKEYQVLVGDINETWLSNRKHPPLALYAGVNNKGEPLYVGRASHEGSIIPGYSTRSLEICVFASGDRQLTSEEFDVFC